MLAIGLCLVVVVAWSMLTGFFQKKATARKLTRTQTAGQTAVPSGRPGERPGGYPQECQAARRSSTTS
jgi:hypothetical protein